MRNKGILNFHIFFKNAQTLKHKLTRILLFVYEMNWSFFVKFVITQLL